MKTTLKLFLAASLAAGKLHAADEPAPTSAPYSPASPPPIEAAAPVVDAVTNAPVANANTGLLLNFKDAQLDTVLDYLSEAAGFIIVREATLRGKVNVVSKQSMSKEEALDVLDSELRKNGLAAIRSGRKLTIVNRDEAKTKGIPVKSGSNPDSIPLNDEIVTQIMPVRYVEVSQLIKDLQPLVSSQTTMTANEAGNSLIITDSQANIHRVAEIIKAIDSGAEDVTDVRVFKLQYADPTEMATLLTSAFPDDSRSSSSGGGSQSPFSFGGRGGGGGGGFGGFFGRGGGGDTGGSNAQNQRIKKRTKVTAVPDPRTASVIVTATSGLMDQIARMIEQLDSNPAKKQKVYVFSLENADPQQVQQVLSDMFESGNSRSSSRSSQQNNALQNRANQNQTSGTSGNNSGFGTGGGNRSSGGTRSGGF